MGDGGTGVKGRVADRGEGRREREGAEGGAEIKGPQVDAGERGGQCDLGERVTFSKRLSADGGDAGGEHASREGSALKEGILADGSADGVAEVEEAQRLEVAPYEGCLLPARNGDSWVAAGVSLRQRFITESSASRNSLCVAARNAEQAAANLATLCKSSTSVTLQSRSIGRDANKSGSSASALATSLCIFVDGRAARRGRGRRYRSLLE